MKNLKLNKNLQNLIKKGATFALVSTLVLTPVKAENTKHYEKYTATQINVTSGIDVFVNGKYFNPKDVNGNIVEPFVYNGTTYLPARAISNIFGAKISWDSTVNGVLIENSSLVLNTYLGWHALIGTVICMVLNLGLEYPFQRFVVFRNSIDQTEKKEK